MKPMRINLRNLGSHLETELNLKGIQSMIFTGDTGAGKSTTIEGMAWALWGSIAGGIDQAVHHGETEASVTVEFEAGNQTYRVQRGRKLTARGSSSLEFEIADSSVMSGWRSLAGANIADTEKRIIDVVGPYDLACSTWLSLQGQTGRFTAATAGERRAIMNRLLNLDPWAARRDAARDLSKDYAAKVDAAAPRRGEYEATIALRPEREALVAAAREALKTAQQEEAAAQIHKADAAAARDALIASQVCVREARAKLQATQDELNGHITAVIRMRAELAAAEDTVRNLEFTGGFSAEKQMELNNLKAREHSLADQLETIRKRGEVAAEDLRTAERAKADAQAELEKARNALVAEWNTKRTAATEKLSALRQSVATAERNLSTAKQAVLDAARDYRANWESRKSEVQRQVLQAKSEMDAAAARLRTAETELDNAKADAADLDGVPCGGREGFSGCRYLTRAVQSRNAIADLERKVADCRSAAEAANEKFNAARNAEPQLGTTFPEFVAPESMTAEVSEKELAVDQTKRDAQAASVELGDLVDHQPVGNFPELQAKALDSIQNTMATQAAKDAVIGEWKTAKAEHDAVRGNIYSLENQKAAAEGTQQKLADARAQVVSVTAQIERAQEQRTGIEQRIEALKPDAHLDEDLDGQVSRAKGAVDSADFEVSTAMRAVAQKDSTVRDAERVLAECDKAAAEIEKIDELTASDRQMAADLNTLSQAYADVPQLIVETIIPDIEATANKLLAAISATGITVSLRTQKAIKSDKGRLAETLDIIVTDQIGERVYERYSGGERFEIDLALRVALTRVLSARSNLDLRTFVIDEGFGTQDAGRIQAIAGVLNTIAAMFGLCVVISHVEGLAEVMPHEAHFVKTAGASRLEWR